MVSPGMSTATLVAHAVFAEPVGQVLPGTVDVAVVVSALSPGSGLRTVTEAVMVTVAPTARLPVQVSVEPLTDTAPAVAETSPLYVASSRAPASATLTVLALYGVCPVLASVTV